MKKSEYIRNLKENITKYRSWLRNKPDMRSTMVKSFRGDYRRISVHVSLVPPITVHITTDLGFGRSRFLEYCVTVVRIEDDEIFSFLPKMREICKNIPDKVPTQKKGFFRTVIKLIGKNDSFVSVANEYREWATLEPRVKTYTIPISKHLCVDINTTNESFRFYSPGMIPSQESSKCISFSEAKKCLKYLDEIFPCETETSEIEPTENYGFTPYGKRLWFKFLGFEIWKYTYKGKDIESHRLAGLSNTDKLIDVLNTAYAQGAEDMYKKSGTAKKETKRKKK